MKVFFLIAAAVLTSCVSSTVPQSVNQSEEIEKVVREYFSKSRPSRIANNPDDPPLKVFGVTLHQETPTFYIVGADLEWPDGKRNVVQVLCRQYTGDGKAYWKAEPMDWRFVENIRKPDKDKLK